MRLEEGTNFDLSLGFPTSGHHSPPAMAAVSVCVIFYLKNTRKIQLGTAVVQQFYEPLLRRLAPPMRTPDTKSEVDKVRSNTLRFSRQNGA